MSRGIGFFGQGIEGHISQFEATNPSTMTGIPVRTIDVLKKEAKNPWLMSIQSISIADWHRLWADSEKSGTSVVTRVPGVTKDSRTHVNPRQVDGFLGGAFGQLFGGVDPATDLAEVTLTGGQFMTPTIIGVSSRAKSAVSTNFGPAQISAFTSASSSLGYKPLDPFKPSVRIHPEDWAKSKTDNAFGRFLRGLGLLDPKTGKVSLPDAQESTAPGGQSIATGTLLMDRASLGTIANGNLRGALGLGGLGR